MGPNIKAAKFWKENSSPMGSSSDYVDFIFFRFFFCNQECFRCKYGLRRDAMFSHIKKTYLMIDRGVYLTLPQNAATFAGIVRKFDLFYPVHIPGRHDCAPPGHSQYMF